MSQAVLKRLYVLSFQEKISPDWKMYQRGLKDPPQNPYSEDHPTHGGRGERIPPTCRASGGYSATQISFPFLRIGFFPA